MEDLIKSLKAEGKDRQEKGKKPGLPGDVKDLKGHAERLWSYLDTLAEESPEAYQNFLSEQASAAGIKLKPAATSEAQRQNPFTSKKGNATLVIITHDKKSSERVALYVWEEVNPQKVAHPKMKSGRKVGEGEKVSIQDLKIEAVSEESPRFEMSPEGLLADGGRYSVVDVLIHQLIAKLAVEIYKDDKGSALKLLCYELLAWANQNYGYSLDKSKMKLLVLRAVMDTATMSRRAKVAASGTSAEGLSENTLSEIASLSKSGGGQIAKPLIEVLSTSENDNP